MQADLNIVYKSHSTSIVAYFVYETVTVYTIILSCMCYITQLYVL